jgi:hypothetical protein
MASFTNALSLTNSIEFISYSSPTQLYFGVTNTGGGSNSNYLYAIQFTSNTNATIVETFDLSVNFVPGETYTITGIATDPSYSYVYVAINGSSDTSIIGINYTTLQITNIGFSQILDPIGIVCVYPEEVYLFNTPSTTFYAINISNNFFSSTITPKSTFGARPTFTSTTTGVPITNNGELIYMGVGTEIYLLEFIIGNWNYTICTNYTSANTITGLTYVDNQSTNTFYLTQENNSILSVHELQSSSNTNFSSNSTYSTVSDGVTALTVGFRNSNTDAFLTYSNGANLFVSNNTVNCFNEDSKILVLNELMDEVYKPIQELKKGDLVKTYLHGYRKIEMIGKGKLVNNPKKWDSCMYKMVATVENGLLEDLVVTGGHSILADEISEVERENMVKLGLQDYNDKIDDKVLVLAAISEKFVAVQDKEIYNYYHFVLEGNDEIQRFGIWANGILSETISKKYFVENGLKAL